jgi:hypothetical protein
MESLGHFFHAAEPYALQTLLGLVALFGVLKDWKEYARFKKPVAVIVLVGTIAVYLLSLFETYDTRRDARLKEETASRKEVESKKQIEVLTEQVSQEREENKQNANGFRTSFSQLYDKYSELAARSKNPDLIREIKRTQNELKATQDKLNQPKARLNAGFWAATDSYDFPHEINIPRRPDGSVAFDICASNPTDVTALNGAFDVRICRLCKFAKEPQGSNHVSGSREEDREIKFDHIFAHSNIQKYAIEVIPPPSAARFQVDIFYRCENCEPGQQSLFVNIE